MYGGVFTVAVAVNGIAIAPLQYSIFGAVTGVVLTFVTVIVNGKLHSAAASGGSA